MMFSLVYYRNLALLLCCLCVGLHIHLCVAREVPPRWEMDLSSVDDVAKGMGMNDQGLNLTERKVKIDVVILIYTYGKSSIRYKLTEKIFMHYRNIQLMFQEFSQFSFTIVGSEKEVSRNLSDTYFPEDSYLEYFQPLITREMKHGPYKMCSIITKKVQAGMNYSFHHKDSDIMMWAGSNDYVSFNFWRQMIESYDPTRMAMFGIQTYDNSRSIIFYTKFDGHRIFNRTSEITYWQSGEQGGPRYNRYHFIGGVIGVTTNFIAKYPTKIFKWNYDEGEVERHFIRTAKRAQDNMKIHLAKEVAFMNIKVDNGHEISSLENLKLGNSKFTVPMSNLSDSFLQRFDQEFKLFDDLLVSHH
mmetsp:Transcript_19106/g.31980  ORF Transcript_19106/g.31980 Transcript_19106/m.31980 type:complete len:358 (-) Transcript_19106:167-1240(-)